MVCVQKVRYRGLPEKYVVGLWWRSARRKDLRTEDGKTVRVVYPGRWNDGRGADILDSVIAIDEKLQAGDIEIHTRSGDWWAHKHDRDPVYNSVILHVVFWHDARDTIKLQNGTTIPTLALHRHRKRVPHCGIKPSSTYSYVPCDGVMNRLGAMRTAEFLDWAGEERFLRKAEDFRAALNSEEAGQVLYQGIMGALGYVKNKLPFQELARRLPLRVLEQVAGSGTSEEGCLMCLQAQLIGNAGLLPSQSRNQRWGDEGDWVCKLEEAWTPLVKTTPMSESCWHLFKVRPNNFPTRRIAAMSYLILHYGASSMVTRMLERVREASGDHGFRELEGMLLIEADGYWAKHYDFGSVSRIANSALIGRATAATVVVNVLLPFAFAWAGRNSPPELAEKASSLYRQYPRLPGNAVEVHMRRQMGLSDNLVNSARRQQGLLHIYRTLCTQGRCGSCHLVAGARTGLRGSISTDLQQVCQLG